MDTSFFDYRGDRLYVCLLAGLINFDGWAFNTIAMQLEGTSCTSVHTQGINVKVQSHVIRLLR